MRALLIPAVAVLSFGIGALTGIVLMARSEIPAAPMVDPPRWERSL